MIKFPHPRAISAPSLGIADSFWQWLYQRRFWCVCARMWWRHCHKQWHPSVAPGCAVLTLCYCRIHSQSRHSVQRKCLFSRTDLNAIWLSGANSVVLIQEMISPENMEKEGSKERLFSPQPSSCIPCHSAGGSDHNCYQLALVWLCIEGSALLPTKTHISGCNWN